MRRQEMSLTDEEDTNEQVDPQITALRDNARNNNRTAIASRIRYLRTSASSDPANEPPSSNDTERQAEIQALIEAAGIGKFSTADGAITDPQVLTRICSSVSGLEEAALSKSRTETEDVEPPQDRTLVEACGRGDVVAVQQLLSSGWNANETTDEGESLLSLACSSGQYELVEVLLQHNAQVEECGAKGECTPLMEAASGGYANVVQLLINHGADVNSTSSTGNTALTYASCGGFEDVVKILIDNGAALESHNENGHTPLMEAASGGHVPVAELLLKKGAGINTSSHEFKESALTLACYKGHLSMVRYLLTRGADQEHKTDEMHTALMEASMDGHVDVARLLLDSGAQVNMPTDSFESPLTLAACGGHVELAQLLIARGALLEEVNDEGYTAIMEAAREGHEEMVTLLLSKGCNVNAKTEETQETALTLACCGGFLEVVELLVDGGADIELGSSTPLMEAAQEGQIEVVKFLIDKNADVKATTKSDDTALHFACEQGHTDIAELLLQHGAELEYKTECGRTPLMKAARAGHLCAVQFLIAQGANVNNVTNNNDHSVLSLACAFGHTNVVETLLCQGADPSYKLKDDSNMLLEASRNGHVNVVKLLLDFPRNYVAVSPENQTQSDDLPLRPLSDVTTDQLGDAGAGGDGAAAYTTSYDGVVTNGVDPPIIPFEEPSNIGGGGGGSENFDENMSEQAAAVVTRLIQHGSWLTQAAEGYLPQSAKEEVEKDVTFQIERFLRTMASDPSVGLALVEGNCKELEARVMKAVEKQFYLLYGDKSSQIMRQILEDKNKTYDDRGNPDGSDPFATMEGIPSDFSLPDPKFNNEHPAELLPQQIRKNQAAAERIANAAPHGLHMINNGSSGCISQVAKEEAESFCQCQRHQCPINPEVHDERDGDDQTSSNDAPSGGLLSAYLKPDVDACTESNHDTPLTLACAGGHEELVQLLLANGASIEHRDKKGFTPLILAATAGHVNVVRILSLQKANLEAQSDRTKDTPLSLACSGGRMEVVQMLLQHGANKEHRNVSDYTPLSLAASGGYVQIIKMLLSNGAEINSRYVPEADSTTPCLLTHTTPKQKKTRRKNKRRDEQEQHGGTGSKLGISPLMLAAMNGHTQAVQLLLDMGADINAQIETNRNTALTLACFQGRHEVVSLLVDRKANVEHRAKTGLTPLMEAASGGYAEVGKVLLDKGADPNAAPVPSSRDTALTIAADKGHFRFCELILERGAQVEVRNKKGNTSLWLACNGGHHEVVKLLVNKGADVNAADNRNVTPLMASFRKGHVPVVQYLANVVSQFPSENECERFILNLLSSDKDQDLRNRLKQCKECIEQSKARQAEEANKYAANLLQEIDREHVNEEKRKARQAKKREKKKLRKRNKAKKEEEDATPKKEEETLDVDESTAETADDSDRMDAGCSRVPQPSDIRSTPNDRPSSPSPSSYEFLNIFQPSSPPPTAHHLPKSAAISSSSNATQGAKQPATTTTTTTTSSSDLTSQTPTVNKTPTTTTHNNRSSHNKSSSSNVSTTTTQLKQSATVVNKSSDDTTTPTRSSPLSSKGIPTKSSSAESSTSSSTIKYDSPVASPRSSQHRENSGRKSKPSSKPSSSSSSSSATTLTGSAVKQYNRSELSQNSKSAQARLSGAAVSSSGISPSSTSSTSKVSSPAKRGVRREEAGGWKEVSSRKCTSNTLKLYVHSRLISRLIGRAGCNINAIREATGAHIDIDKQRKGSQERTVTIKGSHEAQTHAYNLITTIIREDGSDQDVQQIINRMQQATISGANQTSGNHGRNPPTKPHLQVIEAPIPARSAWNVPPPIVVSKSNAPWANTGGSSAAASAAPPNGNQQSSSIRTPSASSVVYTNSILKGQSENSFLVSPSAVTIQNHVIRDDKLLAAVTSSGKKDVRKNLFPTQTFELNESSNKCAAAAATSCGENVSSSAAAVFSKSLPAAPMLTTTTTSPFIFSPNKTKSGADKPVQPVAPMMAATKVPRSNPVVPPSPANPSPPQQTLDNMDMMTSSSKNTTTMSPPHNKPANTRAGTNIYDQTTLDFETVIMRDVIEQLSRPSVPATPAAVIANVTSSAASVSVPVVEEMERGRVGGAETGKSIMSYDHELKPSSVAAAAAVPTESSSVVAPTSSVAYVVSSQADVDVLLLNREHDLQQGEKLADVSSSTSLASKRIPIDVPQIISSSSNGIPSRSPYGNPYGIAPDVSQFVGNAAATNYSSGFGPGAGNFTTIWQQQNQKTADKNTPQNVESVVTEAEESKPMLPAPIGNERRQNCKVSNSSVVSSTASSVVEQHMHQQNANSLHQSTNPINQNHFWHSSDMLGHRGWGADELSNQSVVGGVSHPQSQMIMSESLRQQPLHPSSVEQRSYNKPPMQQQAESGVGGFFGAVGSSRYNACTPATNNPSSMKQQQQQSHIQPIGSSRFSNYRHNTAAAPTFPQLQAQQQQPQHRGTDLSSVGPIHKSAASGLQLSHYQQLHQQQQQQQHSSATAHMNQQAPINQQPRFNMNQHQFYEDVQRNDQQQQQQQRYQQSTPHHLQQAATNNDMSSWHLGGGGGGGRNSVLPPRHNPLQPKDLQGLFQNMQVGNHSSNIVNSQLGGGGSYQHDFNSTNQQQQQQQQQDNSMFNSHQSSGNSFSARDNNSAPGGGGNHLDNNDMFRNASGGGGGMYSSSSSPLWRNSMARHQYPPTAAAAGPESLQLSAHNRHDNQERNWKMSNQMWQG